MFLCGGGWVTIGKLEIHPSKPHRICRPDPRRLQVLYTLITLLQEVQAWLVHSEGSQNALGLLRLTVGGLRYRHRLVLAEPRPTYFRVRRNVPLHDSQERSTAWI